MFKSSFFDKILYLQALINTLVLVVQARLQTRFGQWWDNIPFLTSAVVIVCSIIYLVCLLIGYDSFFEICFLPSAIISRFQGKTPMHFFKKILMELFF